MGFGLTKKEKFASMLHEVTGGKHSDKIGSVGHAIIEYAGHGTLALASTTMKQGFFGADALRPDTIALALSGLGYAFGGKKLKKTAASALRASFHALITRLVIAGKSVLIHGPDGQWTFKMG